MSDEDKNEKVLKLLNNILDELLQLSYRVEIIESKVNCLMGVNPKLIH